MEIVNSVDIWSFGDDYYKVVPTNLGWRKDGANVMGAGVAKQATERYPELAAKYGGICRAIEAGCSPTVAGKVSDEWKGGLIARYQDLILLPVKPLNEEKPWLSWQQEARLDLVTESVRELAIWDDAGFLDRHTVLPMVGCGNGKLPPTKVLPILFHFLGERENFTLIIND